jgi:hypothetical protein
MKKLFLKKSCDPVPVKRYKAKERKRNEKERERVSREREDEESQGREDFNRKVLFPRELQARS